MTVLGQAFRVAVAASALDLPGAALLPQRLARACALVLPVDGAGISMFFTSDRRLPLGANDEVAGEAERLQFTVGEGPCLSAHEEGRPVVADEAALAARWPTYYAELACHTPIRGIISLPLQDEMSGFGALDLYTVPPRSTADLSLADAQVVTAEVTLALRAHRGRGSDGGADDGREGDGRASWLSAPGVERRALVWQAMGFLNASLRISSPDALAMLRAHAYSRGEDVDAVAAAVLDRRVPIEELALDTEPG